MTLDDQPLPLPYKEMTHADYASAFLNNPHFSWDMADGMLILRGVCPRCQGITKAEFTDKMVRSSDARSADASRNKLTLECKCACDHAQRPADVQGCGAYWGLSMADDTS